MKKRILITGAGSGLGRSLALQWAASQSRIALADIQPDMAEETLKQVEAQGGTGIIIPLDVRNDTDWHQARETVANAWGGIDVLVNNAGVASGGTLVETSLEDWDWMLDINLKGVIRGCHTFTQDLVEQGNGHIVNIASFAGIAQVPGMISYNVAKTGVISLSETLRAELHGTGVGVSLACPSFFKTNLMDSFRGGNAQRKWVNKVMDKATVTAQDVAADIVAAVNDNRFLVITHQEARWHYRYKRFSPEGYFKQLVKVAKKMAPTNKT